MDKRRLVSQEKSETGRWAKIADDMHKDSPLHGLSDEVNKASQEFRDNFAFNHDK
jgi:hypothetical protein